MGSGKGEARYRLTLDHSDFDKGLHQVEEQFKKFGETVLKGVGFGAGFEVGEKAAEALIDTLKEIPAAAIEVVEHLEHVAHSAEELHHKTGLSVTAAQELSVGMRIAGGDSEVLAQLIGKMQKKLVEGSGAFAHLGLDARKLKQEDIGTAFVQVADKIHGLTNETERSAARQAIFGKSGNAAAKFIDEGVRELSEDAHHLGAVLGDETVAAAGKLGEEGRRLSIAWEAVQNQFAAAIVSNPDLLHGLEAMVEWAGHLAHSMHENAGAIGAFTGAMTQEASLWFHTLYGWAEKLGVKVKWLAEVAAPGLAEALELANAKAEALEAARLARKLLAPKEEGGEGGGSYDPSKHSAETKAIAALSIELGAVQAKHTGVYAAMMAQVEAATAKRLTEAAVTHAGKDGLAEIERGIKAVGAAMLANAKIDFVKQMLGPGKEAALTGLNDIATAVELVGGVAALTFPQLQTAADKLTALGLAGHNSALGMQVAAEQMERLNAAKDYLLAHGGLSGTAQVPGMATGIDFTKQSSSPTLAAFGSKAEEGRFDRNAESMTYWTRYKDVVKELKAEFDNTPAEHARQWTEAIQGVGAALQGVASYLQSGWLGAVAGVGSAAMAVFDGLRNRIKNMSTAQKVQAGAAAAQGALNIYAAAREDPHAGHRTLQGAESGAAAGAAFGPTGVVIGALAGAAIAFFSGPKWAETAKTAGKVLGGEVSNELAKKIHDTKFKFGVSAENASLLHLADYMQESGKAATQVMPQMTALMGAIASGAVPAREGLEQLNAAFGDLAQAASDGDAAAQKTVASLIKQGVAAGKLTESMKALIQESMGAMAGGGDKILAGVQMIGKDVPLGSMGTAAAQSFTAGFTASIAQKGLVAALEDSGKGIEAFYQRLSAEGNTAAAGLLAPFAQLSEKINNEADPSLKGFLTTLQGMSEVYGGLDKIGFVTADAFTGLETGIQGTANALSEAGVTGPAALQALAPQLAQIIQGHEKYGMAIDENTQSLIRQAHDAGIAFPTDPLQQMIGLLGQIVTLMGGTLPAAAQTAATAAQEAVTGTASASEAALASTTDSLDAMTLGTAATTSTAGEMVALAVGSMQDQTSTTLGELVTDMGTAFGTASKDAVLDLDKVRTAMEELPTSSEFTVRVGTKWLGGYNNEEAGGGPDRDMDPTTPAAHGWHGVVSSPTKFLVGEHGPERFDASPLGSWGGGAGSDGDIGALLSEVHALNAHMERQPRVLVRALKDAGLLGRGDKRRST